jgi:hypothetical protein
MLHFVVPMLVISHQHLRFDSVPIINTTMLLDIPYHQRPPPMALPTAPLPHTTHTHTFTPTHPHLPLRRVQHIGGLV